MKFVEQIERLQYLDELIRKGNTGPPRELARRLGISRSQLYNLIDYFDDFGIHVKFSRTLNSFYYNNQDKNLEIKFSIKVISEKKERTIHGGYFTLFLSANQIKHDLINY